MKDLLIIGKIVGVHGIHGEVKILPMTDDARRFFDLKSAFLLTDKEKLIREVQINSVRVQNNVVVSSLMDLTDRDEARKLSGCLLAIDRARAANLSDGRYFIADLEGIVVKDHKIGHLGVISEIMQSAGSDIIVVSRENKADLLIPFLKSIVQDVDIKNQQMMVILPDGLYEIYE